MTSDSGAANDHFAQQAEIEAAPDPTRYQTLRRLAEDEDRRLVLSLGGGSFPGLCGNAMLLRLVEELGLREHVDEVWGTSAGAVIGAAWAGGRTADELVPLGKRFAQPETIDVPRLRIALSLLFKPFGGRLPDGLVRAGRVRDALTEMIPVARLEDCAIPFRCVAVTDDGTSRRKIFRRGPIVPAVYASMCVPGVFEPAPPVEGDAAGYLDGGLAEKTPLLSPIAEHRRLGGKRELVLLCTHYGAHAKRPPPRGFLRRFLHAIEALENLTWRYQLAEARGHPGVVVLMLKSGIDDVRLFDFERVDLNLLQARAHFKRVLQDAHIAAAFGTE